MTTYQSHTPTNTHAHETTITNTPEQYDMSNDDDIPITTPTNTPMTNQTMAALAPCKRKTYQ